MRPGVLSEGPVELQITPVKPNTIAKSIGDFGNARPMAPMPLIIARPQQRALRSPRSAK